ncbi:MULTISPECIES: sugar phosphate isomerase/epimerase [unclassified Actinomyces]|uniref:sugar phosphate isomerase/epimerase family protein n=1 Tax=unclassified Actinomyces TaxID=2609248 RepID=UPI000D598413|nr:MULTISPECIES: sugar phosphate isomerase/epimerase [unclassified Actinomyces]RAX18998.1 sugar phosphate isomerase [Actinomyces sp. Z3]
MKDTLKWAYALNQWKPRMDAFTRHEDQLRAFKVTSAAGFDYVELASGSGRWDNLARPEVILANHGSAEGFLDFLHRGSLKGVCSMFWDPTAPAEEDDGMPHNPADFDQHATIIRTSRVFIDFLNAVGASTLVARPAPPAWITGKLSDDAIKTAADLWNEVGDLARQAGLHLALHYDCLSSIHDPDQLATLLGAADPELVGLGVDTAEMTIAGIDPVAFYQAHADRVTHIHLKDTRHQDSNNQYLKPNAEIAMFQGDSGNHIQRWFYELGTPNGLVDTPTLVTALREHSYNGWTVVESDQTPDPAETTLLNSWYLQNELDIPK